MKSCIKVDYYVEMIKNNDNYIFISTDNCIKYYDYNLNFVSNIATLCELIFVHNNYLLCGESLSKNSKLYVSLYSLSDNKFINYWSF
jgi:hypothetical protein